MSDLIPQINLAIETYKARQQDIIGLGHRAYKDLFASANAAMLTSVVKDLILSSYSEIVTPNAPKTSLLAAISQQHAEIMAGCRMLTPDDGILAALIDAANGATTEALQLIYREEPTVAAPKKVASKRVKKKKSETQEPAPRPRTPRKRPPAKEA